MALAWPAVGAPVTMKLGKRCGNKARYDGKLAALTALSHMRANGRSEKRAYRCDRCRFWHLTGQPRRIRPSATWPDSPAGLA